MNMKYFGRCNVMKHREINNGEKYITLDISFKFGSQDNMKITSSDPKYVFGRAGKGLITSLGINTIGRSNTNKKLGYAINNASMKYLLKIIKEF